jgi:hypothetical protein
VVRVAIDAPREVAILRGELQDQAAQWGPSVPPAEQPREPSRDQPHEAVPAAKRGRRGRLTRKQLRTASAGLGLARLQLRAGLTDDAQATLQRIHDEIQDLRRCLEGAGKESRFRPAVARPRLAGKLPVPEVNGSGRRLLMGCAR